MATVGFQWSSCLWLMTISDEVDCFAKFEVSAIVLLHDNWHESKCENDEAIGFTILSVANLRFTWSLQPIHMLNEQPIVIHFLVHWSLLGKCDGICYDRLSTPDLPLTLSNMTIHVIFKWLCLSMRHGSQICGKPGAFTCVWLKLRFSGMSTIAQQILWPCHKPSDTGTECYLNCL